MAVFYQIPVIDSMNICPLCKTYNKRKVVSEFRLSKNNSYITIMFKTSYCPSCHIPFVTPYSLKKINEFYSGYRIKGYQYRKGNTPEEVLKTITAEPPINKHFTTISKDSNDKLTQKTKTKKDLYEEFDKLVTQLNQLTNRTHVIIATSSKAGFQNFQIIPRKNSADNQKNILYIRDEFALELLTAAFVKEKDNTAIFNKTNYKILKYKIVSESTSDLVIPRKIIIKHKAGTSEDKGHDIVQLLLYTPTSKRLHPIYASYNPQGQEYYIDGKKLLCFVFDYGKPDIQIDYANNGNSIFNYNDWNSLRKESILMEFGYTVNANSGLDETTRRKILVSMIKLGIIDVRGITFLLNSFILSHNDPKYNHVRECWRKDLQYISDYDVSSNHFIIAAK